MNVKKNEGYALMIVLVFLSIILAMAGVMYEVIFYAQRTRLIERNQIKSLDLAESALQLALWRLQSDPGYAGEELNLFGGSAVIEISPSEDAFSVAIETLYPAGDNLRQAARLSARILKTESGYVSRDKLLEIGLPPSRAARAAPAT